LLFFENGKILVCAPKKKYDICQPKNTKNTMFENLSERLEGAFKLLKGEGRISEINIASTVKEIRRALVDADVSYKIAKELTDKIKERLLVLAY
jgi:signal recognition particle GTPase